jgi:TonB family protein
MKKRAQLLWFLVLVVPLLTQPTYAQSGNAIPTVSAKLTLWDGKVISLSDIVRVALVTEIVYITPHVEPRAFRDLRFRSSADNREHLSFSAIRRAEFGKPVPSGTDPEEQTLTLTMLDGSVRKGFVAVTLKETTEGFLEGDDVSMKRLREALLHLDKIRSIEFSVELSAPATAGQATRAIGVSLVGTVVNPAGGPAVRNQVLYAFPISADGSALEQSVIDATGSHLDNPSGRTDARGHFEIVLSKELASKFGTWTVGVTDPARPLFGEKSPVIFLQKGGTDLQAHLPGGSKVVDCGTVLLAATSLKGGPAADRDGFSAKLEGGGRLTGQPKPVSRPRPKGAPSEAAPGQVAPAAEASAAPPPAPSAPIRVGGNVRPPTKTKHVDPVYPALARSAGVEGVVIFELTVGTDGKVIDAKILRSIPLLDQAATDAVRQWQFTPMLVNGTAVSVIMTATVNFLRQ